VWDMCMIIFPYDPLRLEPCLIAVVGLHHITYVVVGSEGLAWEGSEADLGEGRLIGVLLLVD